MNNFEQSIDENLAEFKTKLVNFETKQFRFESPKEAFWFAIGSYGFPLIVIATFIFLGFMIYHSEVQTQEKADYFSYWIDAADLHYNTHDSTVIPTIKLYQVRDLSEAKAGKNFLYHEACNFIEAPLYFERMK